ncbi:hypothetical protein [Hyphomicrobium sp.]|uniref:hypothetical protein n=1 Tax=Hyphomicrobium sp. TaxID=82 RepID=UPI003F71E01B
MTELAHSVRPHLFSDVRTYTLGNDALAVHHGESGKRVPYADIASVRLISYASVDGPQEQCTIATRAHGKIVVRSHHFVSTGEFEDRSATYAPFVRDLCRRIHAANTKARFIRGSAGLQAGWFVVLACAAIGWAIWIAAVYEGVVGVWQAASVFALLALASFLGFHAFKGNRVEEFDPFNPPVS